MIIASAIDAAADCIVTGAEGKGRTISYVLPGPNETGLVGEGPQGKHSLCHGAGERT